MDSMVRMRCYMIQLKYLVHVVMDDDSQCTRGHKNN